MSRPFFASLCLCCFSVLTALPLQAQNPAPAQLRVTVVDQTGALITSATVRVTRAGAPPVDRPVDGRGEATFPALGIGPVQVHVESDGFAPFDGTLTLRRGNNTQDRHDDDCRFPTGGRRQRRDVGRRIAAATR